MVKLTRRIPETEPVRDFSPQEFYDKRNTILIIRYAGGFGDILMQRFMFEDFKALHPDLKIHYACPPKYHDIVRDHPFIDCLLDCFTVDPKQYLVSYDISTACLRYEVSHYPNCSKHRADIWAEHCGVQLIHHNHYLTAAEEDKAHARTLLAPYKRPIALICPVSAMPIRTLPMQTVAQAADALRQAGCTVLAYHSDPVPEIIKMGIPMITDLTLLQIIGLISEVDYVVSTDTAHFHIAGILGKPMTGIFSVTNGKVYGKYFDKFVLVQKHRDNGDWDCGPCYDWCRCPKSQALPRPCATEVTQDMVSQGIRKMLQQWPITH